MAPSLPIKFIDTALSCTTSPFTLSYPDPDQKRVIRKHLVALLQDYPFFAPSSDTFTHNDGTDHNLLNVAGDLQISAYAPPIPLTIWVSQNYPHTPPLVFVSSNSCLSPIHKDHPFVVDSSGFTTCPYIQTWVFLRCNLIELVRNLIKIFSIDHPFIYFPSSHSTHPSFVSKMEALDHLSGMLHYDIIALLVKTGEETEDLGRLQMELAARSDLIRIVVVGLVEEETRLRDAQLKIVDQAHVLTNWLKYNVDVEDEETSQEQFEAADPESNLVIDCLAGDGAIEDLITALEKGVEDGAVKFDVYLRQVRLLAREQYHYRRQIVNLRGPDILLWHYDS